ncbi:VPLPA-CTERM-specific exosortase XrtD [Nitrospira sp. NS4]|uniref:VPLPA-CTERM-specific exosortase XrtD n=1 Tax=Nitrospira sp. NS4 TaxID=3414498 RepID=UPI003C2CC33C
MSVQSRTEGTPLSPPSGIAPVALPMGKGSWASWGFLAVAVMLLGYLYADSLRFLGQAWLENDNYSHGPFIPLISLYLVWLRWTQLQAIERRGFWWGIPIVFVGLLLYAVGEFAAMYAVVHGSLWLVLVGLITCVVGTSGVALIAFPLFYLLTAIPLPEFLHQELSSRLQLLSSALGVGCLQLIGVVAYREGNVIDLGPIQLQVVEACSGLRYLFPLTALTLLCAYLYRESLWKRVLLFLSSIPISILLNGFRIGAIGVLVEIYGQGAAEGFSHFFEGWIFFVASLGLLWVEMWCLARVGSSASRRPFGELIGSPPVETGGSFSRRSVHPSAVRVASGPVLAGGILLVLAAVAAPSFAPQDFPPPARQSLLDFPSQLGEWQGVSSAMERQYLEALQVDDYVLADYSAVGKLPVNVYVAYYQSPKKGRSSHSPRQCIPGGGWEITSFDTVRVDHHAGTAQTLDVNRVAIQKGGQKQIVYYWFKQRDRWVTSEYLVKWFLFWDSLTRHRADGALVRLVSAVHAGESEAIADGRLQTMAGFVTPLLGRYVPD